MVIFTSVQNWTRSGIRRAGDFEAQVRQAFKNLAAVAKASGGSLANAVKFTLFLTDLGQLQRLTRSWVRSCRSLSGTIDGWVASLPRGARSSRSDSGSVVGRRSVPGSSAAPANTIAARLARAGLISTGFCFAFAARYENETRITPIAELVAGNESQSKPKCFMRRRFPRKRQLRVTVRASRVS